MAGIGRLRKAKIGRKCQLNLISFVSLKFSMAFNYLHLDQTPYEEALRLQEQLFGEALNSKLEDRWAVQTLIMLQHEPVYTLGKSGDPSNLIVPVEDTGATFYRTNRGGDITYHGPGQLVGYPIFDLYSLNMGVRQFVETLEDCIIDCLADYGLKGKRIAGASGVWLDSGGEERKICALGIKISRGVSMHGFAFNINTDLTYFNHIIPCGITDKSVTSLAKEMGEEIDFWEVENNLLGHFIKRFG
jgi:lipoyl(octanoyl) transferase